MLSDSGPLLLNADEILARADERRAHTITVQNVLTGSFNVWLGRQAAEKDPPGKVGWLRAAYAARWQQSKELEERSSGSAQ